MTTELLVCPSRLGEARVLAAVPPGCRGPVIPPPEAAIEGDEFLLSLPEWVPRRPTRHLLPALSALTTDDVSFRFEASAWDGEWSPWVATATIGPAPLAALPAAAGPLEADVDVLTARPPVARVRVRLRGRAGGARRVLSAPWLVAVSASDLEGGPAPAASGATGALPVPVLSQMEQAEGLRHRTCSPTCLAMVLQAHGVVCDAATLAAEVFHAGLDLYGVWPAAIQAAARRGVAGYLLRFPDWDAAEWCLARGLPVIASIRHVAGELSGAAIAGTPGHLVVLRGRDGDRVLVNDPAAPERTGVARHYRLDELARVWLERSGVGYVLFPSG